MKILHIISGLEDGGAEAVLASICFTDLENSHTVISLSSRGKYGPILAENGIKVITIDAARGKFSLLNFIKLRRAIRNQQPDVVQTWMYHGNLIGGLAARLAGIKEVFWSIHHSNLDPKFNKRSTVIIARAGAKFSSLIPRKTVFVAEKSLQAHADIGYSRTKATVINNGYDLSKFTINPISRDRIRTELNIRPDKFLIGNVARYDVLKDHENLLKAFALIDSPDTILALIGSGIDPENTNLVETIYSLGLTDKVLLLGRRNDIPDVMNALDLHVLSSKAEAFPNVLSEAMASGIPCVTTEVGDAAEIVGNTGWVVEPSNPNSLAAAIQQALSELKDDSAWTARKKTCRERVEQNFSFERMLDSYQTMWQTGTNRRA